MFGECIDQGLWRSEIIINVSVHCLLVRVTNGGLAAIISHRLLSGGGGRGGKGVVEWEGCVVEGGVVRGVPRLNCRGFFSVHLSLVCIDVHSSFLRTHLSLLCSDVRSSYLCTLVALH